MALLQLFSAPKHLLFTILLDTLLSFFEVSCFSFSVNVFNAAISLFLHVTLHVFWTYFKLLSGLCSLLVLPLLPFSLFYIPIYIYYKWCHFFLGKKKKITWGVYVYLPSCWFDILFSIKNILHYKEAQVSHLLPILTSACPIHIYIYFLHFHLSFSFISLDNKNMIRR